MNRYTTNNPFIPYIMKRYLFILLTLTLLPPLHANQRIKIACVGNSITYGTGIADRETNAYPVQLQRLLGENYTVGNFGRPGATLAYKGFRPYVIQPEFRQAMDFAGDIVVMHLGINDTDPRCWPNYRDDFVRDYLALIDSFRTVNPKAQFIIARMTPLSDRHHRFESGTRDWHDEIQQAIETVAELSGAHLIDFYNLLHPYPHLLPDAIHPNAEGAGMMARTVYGAITGDYGGLSVGSVYSDNMVLQHGRPLVIRGRANAGEKVSVSVGGRQAHAITDGNGHWKVMLKPLKAGGPYTLSIRTKKQQLTFNNVLAGEVWLCSGQSNMEFMLKQSLTGAKDIPLANHNDIRLFNPQALWRTDAVEWPAEALDSINHLRYLRKAAWQECSPGSVADFSAIAYYFGQMLRDSLNIPIGLICNAVGGSPTESWIDRRTLEFEFPAILRNWKGNDFIQDWVRGRAAQNIKKSTDKLQRHPYEPCYLYEAGILPLDSFDIRGVIWYQGESNAHNKDAHEKLFPLLVGSWRRYWQNDNLPFYYVQLSSLNRPSWPWFRDSQRRQEQTIAHTGMVVSSDQGDSLDVHPRHKKAIGQRLALRALTDTYGHTGFRSQGPTLRNVVFGKNSAVLTFDNATRLGTSDGLPVRTFEIAEHDGLYEPATAEIKGNTIRLHSKKVKHPRYVRYGWQPFTRANLVNEAGLPASTFRSN